MSRMDNEPSLFDEPAGIPATRVQESGSLKSLYEALRRDDKSPPSKSPDAPMFSDTIVVGEGPDHARIMMVGEQPGDQEDLLGRPFVGPAGQMLDRCMIAAGMARSEVFLTNAVKRFKFTQRGKRRLHATPDAGDIAHYRWWLDEEIRLVDPAVVVALGSSALHALTGKKQALAPLRGSPLTHGNRKLVVTVHPSYLLRLPDENIREIERDKLSGDLRIATLIAAA